ncbi:MAG: twin-arginine translocase subunit TatC [Verrucomicrobia bacterium]|nr:twin-arginine translocase subunit TatC [Verrucomicrobiota bacterium]
MADNPEAPRLDDEEEGGGPVKTFLEHLEDLRWVLIKSGTAIIVGMVVCLLAVNQLVSILKWPLARARALNATFSSSHTVNLFFGTNRIASFNTRTNRIGSLDLGEEKTVTLRLEPVEINGRQLLAVAQETNAAAKGIAGKGPNLIFLDPAAPFISSLQLAFFGGILLAAPLVFYFVGQFVVPALKKKEKKYFGRAFIIGVGLFLLGVCFCYFGIMPFALRAAEAYSLWMGVEMPEWRAETYFSFVTKFMLGMGLGFEMPVILLALVKIGILDYRKLASMRRYMIVINLVLGALLTTPEVLTQVLMAIPLQVLYECAVWIAWYWEWKEKKQARLQAARETEQTQQA